MTANTASHGDLEFSCPACGRNSLQNSARVEAEGSFLCTGCGKTVEVGINEIAKAIKAGQRALNATIRGIKKRPQ